MLSGEEGKQRGVLTFGFVEGRAGGHAARKGAGFVDVAAGEGESWGEEGEGGEGDLHFGGWDRGGWRLVVSVAERSLWLECLCGGFLEMEKGSTGRTRLALYFALAIMGALRRLAA